jgi:transposase
LREGIDRHKSFSTISVLNRQGEEVQFQGACREFGKYVGSLGPTEAVVLEASTGSFWWADQIEAKGAECFVVDPRKFRIIKDSWNKTDKHDARNLAKALWVHVVTGESGSRRCTSRQRWCGSCAGCSPSIAC